jgi:homoserine O-succinyltransferase
MPDGALDATERQFVSLLDAASEDIPVRLSLYSLPNVPRNESGARHIRTFYSDAEKLYTKKLDGLIVTGREPLTPDLRSEPYWQSFTQIVDWAKDNTYSTVWSCLAAHATVLYMDGIRRIRSNHKHSGVYTCEQLSDHSLTNGAPLSFRLPHSRWNGIPEDQLNSCGYSVLTRAQEAGVDLFFKQHKSLFVFLQGHPEYESDTLLLEYRRDIGRYFRGDTNTYPLIPRNYLDLETVTSLTALQHLAAREPREELLAAILAALGRSRIEDTWRSTAICLYRNWLRYICAQKQATARSTSLSAQQRVDSEWARSTLTF